MSRMPAEIASAMLDIHISGRYLSSVFVHESMPLVSFLYVCIQTHARDLYHSNACSQQFGHAGFEC